MLRKTYVQPDDGRLGHNSNGNSHNRPGSDVCASAYIGKLKDGTVAIYQTLPWDCRCWLSGSGSNGNANRMAYVGFEICEDNKKNEAYFRAAVMGAAVDLTAYLCKLFGVTPYTVIKSFAQGDALTVLDHSELHGLRLASNHGDIGHWLKLYGLTMEDFRAAVQATLNDGIEAEYIDCDATDEGSGQPLEILFTAKVTCPGTYLNVRKSKSTASESLAKVYQGQIVDVLDNGDADWWRVSYGGVTGYAMAKKGYVEYLQPLTDDAPDAPAPKQPDQTDAPDDDTVTVKRAYLESIYAAIGAMLEVRR